MNDDKEKQVVISSLSPLQLEYLREFKSRNSHLTISAERLYTVVEKNMLGFRDPISVGQFLSFYNGSHEQIVNIPNPNTFEEKSLSSKINDKDIAKKTRVEQNNTTKQSTPQSNRTTINQSKGYVPQINRNSLISSRQISNGLEKNDIGSQKNPELQKTESNVNQEKGNSTSNKTFPKEFNKRFPYFMLTYLTASIMITQTLTSGYSPINLTKIISGFAGGIGLVILIYFPTLILASAILVVLRKWPKELYETIIITIVICAWIIIIYRY